MIFARVQRYQGSATVQSRCPDDDYRRRPGWSGGTHPEQSCDGTHDGLGLSADGWPGGQGPLDDAGVPPEFPGPPKFDALSKAMTRVSSTLASPVSMPTAKLPVTTVSAIWPVPPSYSIPVPGIGVTWMAPGPATGDWPAAQCHDRQLPAREQRQLRRARARRIQGRDYQHPGKRHRVSYRGGGPVAGGRTRSHPSDADARHGDRV